MQACRAYYSKGRFVPLGFGALPEGTQAIITLLDDAPQDVAARLREFEAIVGMIEAAAGESMPELERVRLREDGA
jgi:hypothetical protein